MQCGWRPSSAIFACFSDQPEKSPPSGAPMVPCGVPDLPIGAPLIKLAQRDGSKERTARARSSLAGA